MAEPSAKIDAASEHDSRFECGKDVARVAVRAPRLDRGSAHRRACGPVPCTFVEGQAGWGQDARGAIATFATGALIVCWQGDRIPGVRSPHLRQERSSYAGRETGYRGCDRHSCDRSAQHRMLAGRQDTRGAIATFVTGALSIVCWQGDRIPGVRSPHLRQERSASYAGIQLQRC